MTLHSFIKRDKSDFHRVDISMDYMERENVLDWVLMYLKQNNVPFQIKPYQYEDGEEKEYMYISFPSAYQREQFLDKGNKSFPHFEFI